MSRRLLLPLLAALAVLLAAASASFAATPASTPAARTAADDDSGCPDDQMAVEEDDGTITCSGDAVGDDDGSGDDWSGDDGDDSALCDDWSDDSGDDSADDSGDDGEEWSDDDGSDDASVATADDDACADDEAVAPLLSALHAKVSGSGRRAHVTVSYVLDAPGEVALTLERTAPGLTSGKRCVVTAAKPTGKQAAKGKSAHRGGKSCTRSTAVRGSLVTDGDEGSNTLELRNWKGRRLAPGSYRLTAAPTDDGGTGVTTTFKLAPTAH